MEFGLFGTAETYKTTQSNASRAHAYEEFVDYICEAEALGFSSVFLSEHHFTGINQVSATVTLLAYLAAKTKTIRLGTGVIVLPWHNPVLLAEQIATVDVLSHGRVDFGIGRGYRENEFRGFCVKPEQATEMYDESFEVLMKAWRSGGRFTHHGKYWHYDDIMVEPAPVQLPHPPIFVGATTPVSTRRAGEMGLNVLFNPLGTAPAVAGSIETYADALRSRGHVYEPSRVAVVRSFHMAMNDDELEHGYDVATEFLLATRGLAGGGKDTIVPATKEENRKMIGAAALIGKPELMIERLHELEAHGVERVLLLNFSGAMEGLRIFSKEVMPHFKNKPARPTLKAVSQKG